MFAILPGFLTSLSLIVAIGAQNAFVIRQALTRQHVLVIVLICAASDALLMLAGVGGLGAIISANAQVLEWIRWFGVAYLTWFGVRSVISAFKNDVLDSSGSSEKSLLKVVLMCLTITFLNPHVYLDTVILVGSIANQFGENKWFFVLGAISASAIWFTSLGYGAKAASKLMSKPVFWRVLDIVIAGVMFSVALTLAFYRFS